MSSETFSSVGSAAAECTLGPVDCAALLEMLLSELVEAEAYVAELKVPLLLLVLELVAVVVVRSVARSSANMSSKSSSV
jgi:hypothetical protein